MLNYDNAGGGPKKMFRYPKKRIPRCPSNQKVTMRSLLKHIMNTQFKETWKSKPRDQMDDAAPITASDPAPIKPKSRMARV